VSTAAVIPMTTELTRKTSFWIDVAEHTEIIDHPSYEMAAEHLQAIKALQAEADQTFDPIISKAFAAHKEALAQKKRITEPLNQAEGMLKRNMGVYAQEQARLRMEEERRLREQAEREAAEEREREIEAAEAAGASQEEVAVITEAPLLRRPVVMAPSPKVNGVSSREIWKADVTDLAALVKYVATRPDLVNLLLPNLPAINAQARSLRSAMNIPGVRVWAETNIAARRTS
jgi:hypothetical protein